MVVIPSARLAASRGRIAAWLKAVLPLKSASAPFLSAGSLPSGPVKAGHDSLPSGAQAGPLAPFLPAGAQATAPSSHGSLNQTRGLRRKEGSHGPLDRAGRKDEGLDEEREPTGRKRAVKASWNIYGLSLLTACIPAKIRRHGSRKRLSAVEAQGSARLGCSAGIQGVP